MSLNKQTKEKEKSIKKHSLPSFSFYFAHFFRKVSTFHSYINTNKCNKHELLTRFARSRWLDIGQVLFLRVYGPRLRLGP